MTPAPELVARYESDLHALVAPDERLGVAVSGGPDSLALLLLAAAARPGLVEAATVDHGLRGEAAREAAMVADVCRRLGILHATLLVDARSAPLCSVQDWARHERYTALQHWAEERDLAAVATAHHAEDQAETLLMRLARGSGVGGLAGIRRRRPIALGSGILVVRPLLTWSREELRAIVSAAGLDPVDDPSNVDELFDRTHVRWLLADTAWLQPSRLAASAANLADAEESLDWIAARELAKRADWTGPVLALDPSDLPREIKRRLLDRAIASFGCDAPPGPKLMAALGVLDSGGTTTLAGLKIEGGATWRLSRAPPRRTVSPTAPAA